MGVRLATIEDIPQVLELLKEFHAETLDAYKLHINEEITNLLMQKCYTTSLVLEIDNKIVGVLGGIVTTYPLDNELLYQELVWFVNKKYRLHGISLFKKLEEYCYQNNIKKIGITLMANSKADKLEKFYESMGFEYLEKHFIKNLNGKINYATSRNRNIRETSRKT